MRLFMEVSKSHPACVAGAKAGFSPATAYRLDKDPHRLRATGATWLVMRRSARRCLGGGDAPEAAPGMRPVAIFEEL